MVPGDGSRCPRGGVCRLELRAREESLLRGIPLRQGGDSGPGAERRARVRGKDPIDRDEIGDVVPIEHSQGESRDEGHTAQLGGHGVGDPVDAATGRIGVQLAPQVAEGAAAKDAGVVQSLSREPVNVIEKPTALLGDALQQGADEIGAIRRKGEVVPPRPGVP